MNKQEIFDKVVRHLYAQGKPAMNGANCRYRSNDGLSCAVGCLIPDSCYDPGMENQTVSMEKVQKVLRASGILTGSNSDEEQATTYLLGDLQFAHDHWEGGEVCGYAWCDEVGYLKEVQSKHHLTWPEDVPHG